MTAMSLLEQLLVQQADEFQRRWLLAERKLEEAKKRIFELELVIALARKIAEPPDAG